MPFYIIEVPEGLTHYDCGLCSPGCFKKVNDSYCPLSKAVKAEGLGGVFNIPSDGKPSKNVKLWATEEQK